MFAEPHAFTSMFTVEGAAAVIKGYTNCASTNTRGAGTAFAKGRDLHEELKQELSHTRYGRSITSILIQVFMIIRVS